MMVIREVESRSFLEVKRKYFSIRETREICDCSKLFAEAHVLPIVKALIDGLGALLNLDKTFHPALSCSYSRDFLKDVESML